MSTPRSSLRVGVVGAGIRGGMFARAVHQRRDAELVAICDTRPAAAREVADRLGADVAPDVPALLDRGLDAVVVATPDFAHREPVLAAVAAGVAVLVEKPLATTLDDAEAMAAAAAAGGAPVVVGFENRWNPRFRSVRELVDAGRLGTVRHQVVHLNDTLHVPTAMLPWAARSTPGWFLMPHSLDLALWFTGQEPVRVHAVGVRGLLDARGVPTWDAVDAHVTLADGGVVALHSSWVLPESMPAVYDLRYEAVGTDGAVRVVGADHGVHHYGAGGLRWPQHGVQERGGRILGFPVDMLDDVLDAIGSGDASGLPGVADGLRVTRTLDAVHRSLQTGEVVELGG